MTGEQIEAKAIVHYGPRHQIIKLFEEFSELQKELCKLLDSKGDPLAIAEETGDVLILLDQLIMMYGMAEVVEDFKRRKLDRLLARMEETDEVPAQEASADSG